MVYTPHGFPFVGEMSSKRRVFGVAAERALAPWTDAIIGVCEFERGLAREQGLRARVEVVHNGCEPCPDIAVAPEIAALAGPVVGTVSTLRPAKRLDVLLDAMPRVLAAVPGGAVRDRRRRAARGGPARPGRAARRRAPSFLPWQPPTYRVPARASTSTCSPRAGRRSRSGRWRRRRAGCRRWSPASGGTAESVTPDTGLLVPPREPEALADAIIELLRDDARRAAMSSASRRRYAEHFTVERMVAGTAAVYESVVYGRRERLVGEQRGGHALHVPAGALGDERERLGGVEHSLTQAGRAADRVVGVGVDAVDEAVAQELEARTTSRPGRSGRRGRRR